MAVSNRVTGPWLPVANSATPIALGEPVAAASQVTRSADARATRGWLILILFASVFLQRFGWSSEQSGVPFNLFAGLVAMGMLFFKGQLTIDPVRAALVLLFSAYAVLTVILNFQTASLLSAGLAIATYISFAFMLRSGDELFMDCVRAFRTMVVVVAFCGIAQFLLQTVIKSPFLFTFTGFLPDQMLMRGFATYQPITFDSPLSRSNGFFMLEPSIFSQYMALGIIVELLYFNSKWRLAVLALAVVFSYSGTGLIALVVVPGILFSRRSYGTLVALALLACVALTMSEILHLEVVAQRATEFDSTETSAHARFVAPAELLSRYLFPNLQGLMFGDGAGSMKNFQELMPYETHDPAWAKLLCEYGIVGTIIFGSMLVLALFVHSPSKWLSLALAIGFISFGGEFLDARLQSLLLVFCVWPKQASAFAVINRLASPPLAARQAARTVGG